MNTGVWELVPPTKGPRRAVVQWRVPAGACKTYLIKTGGLNKIHLYAFSSRHVWRRVRRNRRDAVWVGPFDYFICIIVTVVGPTSDSTRRIYSAALSWCSSTELAVPTPLGAPAGVPVAE